MPLSPLSKPMHDQGGDLNQLKRDDREGIALENGPVVAAVPRIRPHGVSHKQAVEDVAQQFGQWRGFSSK